MKTCLELPRLVQKLLDAGFKDSEVRGILGENFLHHLKALRPD
jgi:microsomal dipeptidase-like Zn-dependent dipeptidase